MQDRYLFRGKRIDNGEWVIGNRIDDGVTGQVFIHAVGNSVNESDKVGEEGCLQFVAFEVAPSTICQCTGLKDKNGKLIWENDVVKDLFSDTYAPIRYGSYQNCFDSTKAEHIGFYVDWSGKYTKNYRKDLGYFIHMVDAEAIGNIFDNPELLESEE
nr:MAG TPA: YopX protein [Bacteriophage sp.]